MTGMTGIRSEYAHASRTTMFNHSLNGVWLTPKTIVKMITRPTARRSRGHLSLETSEDSASVAVAISRSPRCSARREHDPADRAGVPDRVQRQVGELPDQVRQSDDRETASRREQEGGAVA